MSTQQGSVPNPDRSGQQAGAKPSLPDLNAQTYPFDVVLRLLDQAAFFNMYALPGPNLRNGPIGSSANSRSVTGIRIGGALHSFDVTLMLPELEKGLRAINAVGENAGKLEDRWVVIPEEFQASPNREPPPTPLDPSRSQRFSMQEGNFRFGDGGDGFRGFGTGRTYPFNNGGRRQLRVGAAGDMLEGFGRLKGLNGTYVISGDITVDRGFTGNIQCRVMDPSGRLSTQSALPHTEPWSAPDPGVTYLVFRGQKKSPYEQTSYIIGPDGQPRGFSLGQELRIVHLDFTTRGRGGLRSSVDVGQVVGEMKSQVFLNILAPGAPGTGLMPIPFQSYNEYTFTDSRGRSIGSFVAEGGEGRTFTAQLAEAPGQQALRFGAFQNLTKGTGCFNGVEGLLSDNSIVGVAPHATSTLYTLRIDDPDEKYRAAMNHAWHE